jgi:hypothetical protein
MDPGFWRGGAAANPRPPHSASRGIPPPRPDTREHVENKYDIKNRPFLKTFENERRVVKLVLTVGYFYASRK